MILLLTLMLNAVVYNDIVLVAARTHRVNPAVLSGLIERESKWNTLAESKGHDCGLAQVHITRNNQARCEQMKDPLTGVMEGAKRLASWQRIAKGDIRLALKMYHRGYLPSNYAYADDVLTRAKKYRKIYGKIQITSN